MGRLEILNTRKVKQILSLLESQFGCTLEPKKYAFFINRKDKVYLVNRSISQVDFNEVYINSIGLYLGTMQGGALRLSIDGSQMIAPLAKKNILDLSEDEVALWMSGQTVELETDLEGFVIVRSKTDILGCGKISKNVLYNYVPKERRVYVEEHKPSIDEELKS